MMGMALRVGGYVRLVGAISARRRTQLIEAGAAGIEVSTAVTAARRWRGRCKLKFAALCLSA
jgi:thiamine monophosphate synthase